MERFDVRIAGLHVEMHSLFPAARDFCRDYLTADSASAAFSVSSDPESVEHEQRHAKRPITLFYADALCLQKQMVEQLPFFDRFFFHGAAFTYGNDGFLLSGPSGVGKTTHVRLWQKYLGEDRVRIVNGDKNILCVGDSRVTVCSTPWAGKEQWQENRTAPLRAICFLKQGKHNAIRLLSPQDAVLPFLYQLYVPKNDASVLRLIGLTARVCKTLPVYELTCDMSEDAVKTSFEALTGNRYPPL